MVSRRRRKWGALSARMRMEAGAAFALFACLCSCDAVTSSPPSTAADDVEVEILNPDRPRPLRCNPEIRLDRKIAAAELESLTRRLLEREASDCGFGLVTYYLPAMQPGSGAWAIAEVGDAAVRISILGLSTDERYRTWTPLAEIPQAMIDATLLQEDRFYFRHPGVSAASFETTSPPTTSMYLKPKSRGTRAAASSVRPVATRSFRNSS